MINIIDKTGLNCVRPDGCKKCWTRESNKIYPCVLIFDENSNCFRLSDKYSLLYHKSKIRGQELLEIYKNDVSAI